MRRVAAVNPLLPPHLTSALLRFVGIEGASESAASSSPSSVFTIATQTLVVTLISGMPITTTAALYCNPNYSNHVMSNDCTEDMPALERVANSTGGFGCTHTGGYLWENHLKQLDCSGVNLADALSAGTGLSWGWFNDGCSVDARCCRRWSCCAGSGGCSSPHCAHSNGHRFLLSRCGENIDAVNLMLRPTAIPSTAPTNQPTSPPNRRPTRSPTRRPTRPPTRRPTPSPTMTPSVSPTTLINMGCVQHSQCERIPSSEEGGFSSVREGDATTDGHEMAQNGTAAEREAFYCAQIPGTEVFFEGGDGEDGALDGDSGRHARQADSDADPGKVHKHADKVDVATVAHTLQNETNVLKNVGSRMVADFGDIISEASPNGSTLILERSRRAPVACHPSHGHNYIGCPAGGAAALARLNAYFQGGRARFRCTSWPVSASAADVVVISGRLLFLGNAR